MRTYAQHCAVATALDAIGDRWTLLVVRELLSGPKRYTDLQDGLPGISTDVLAARLRDLEAAGLLERRVLPPPAASKVYELTPDGAALEPVLVALARWGTARLPDVQQGEFRPQWLELSLRALFQPRSTGAVTADFEVDGFRLRASIRDGELTVERDPQGSADVVVRGDSAAIVALAKGGEHRTRALASGSVTVDGAARAVKVLERAFGVEPAER